MTKTLNEYHTEADRTFPTYQAMNRDEQILLAVMGLGGEAGEVVDYYKKVLFHGHELDRDKLIDETGDVLWYVAAMATALDVTLEEIAEYNIKKLRKRYPENFTSELSINRSE